MRSRNKIRIQFIVEDIFVFSASCIATVKVDLECAEIVDEEYCKDIEDFEDVEFIEVLSDKYNEDDIPNEEDVTEEDIQEIISITLT